MEIIATDEFTKCYKKLSRFIQHKAQKQEKLFQENPWHPSLNTEKLEPKKGGYWSFRVDRKYRIIFRFLNQNRILLITVGKHDWIYDF